MTVPHVEVLTEEPSMEAFLEVLLPRLLPQTTFAIHSFQNKRNLLKRLATRLRACEKWVPENYRIAVVIDRDNGDCLELKERLESLAVGSGLATRTRSRGGRWQVVNRVVVEELEAWYFGDWEAVCRAYPRASRNVPRKAPYRHPDSIKGGTSQRPRPWRPPQPPGSRMRAEARQPVAKVPAAFERRCIPPDCVVRRLHIPICALLTPRQAGASPLSVQRGVSPRAAGRGLHRFPGFEDARLALDAPPVVSGLWRLPPRSGGRRYVSRRGDRARGRVLRLLPLRHAGRAEGCAA